VHGRIPYTAASDAMNPPRRLARRAALSLLCCTLAARGDDWLVARHDPQRTGASAGRVNLPSATIRWRHYLGGALGPSQYVIDDVDRDGVTEVVFVSSGKVIAKRADDTLVWESSLIDARSISALADLDGDGRREVVVTADRGNVLVLDGGDGRVRWEVPAALRGMGASVRLGDLDGDGRDDLYLGECVRNPVAAVALSFRAGYASPQELWRMAPLPDACGTNADVLGDLDGDGAPELVMALGYNHLRVFSGRTGALFYDLQPPASGLFGTFTTPVIRELDGDPGGELILVTNGYSAVPSPYGARRVAVYDHVREGGASSLRLRWEANGPDTPGGNVAFEDESVTDVDGDGAPELTVSFYDSATRRWTLETRDARTGALRARRDDAELAGVRDLDGDGRPEVLAVEGDRALVILRWEAGGWAPRWSLEGRRPARALDLPRDARERFSQGPLLVQLDEDPTPELILVPFDPNLPAELRLVTSLEAWDLTAGALRRLGRLDAPVGTTVLTASVGNALSRPYPQPVAVTSDGYFLALDREMTSTNRIVTAEFTIPGMRVGGYVTGASVLGHTPVIGPLGPGGERAVLVRDARPALVRLDARGASLSAPARVRWSRPRSAYPALTDLDGDGALDCAVLEGRDVLGLDADGAPRWTARDVAPRGMFIIGDVLPLRLADGSAHLAVHRGDANVQVRPVVLRARDGAVRWNNLTRPTNSGFGQISVGDLDGDGGDDLVFAASVMQAVSGDDGRVVAEGPSAPYSVQILAPFRGGPRPDVFASAAARGDRLLGADLALLAEGEVASHTSPYGALTRCDGALRVAASPIGSSEVRLIDPTRLRSTTSDPAAGVLRRVLLAGGRVLPAGEAVPAGLRAGALANLTAVADLDGRGTPGLLVGSTDGHLYALDACTLALRWALDFRAPVGEPVVGDADGDGVDDVLVSVGDGYLYALGPRTLAASDDVRDLADEAGVDDVDQVESADTVHTEWRAVPGALRYEVRVLTASGTAVRFPDYTEVSGTRARLDGLPLRLGGRYRVGVIPVGADGSGPEALSDGFTVVDESPPAVTIGVLTPTFAPRAGERAEIELRFTDRTGVARVHAEIRRADGGAVAVLDDETLRTPAPSRTTRAAWTGARDDTRIVEPPGTFRIVAEVTDVAGRTASAEGSITLTEAPVRADGGVGTARTGTDHGCGCGVPGPRPSPAPIGLLALGLLRRRRRRHVG
jgi:MYXO-CTERM domain-containing protein